jgi:hypothetical protein
VPFPYPMT